MIIDAIDSSEYFGKWKKRNFLYNGDFLDWNYDEVLEAYQAAADSYLRHQDTDKARFFIKRMFILDPEYFYKNDTDAKFLFKRFIALKFTIGINGIASRVIPRLTKSPYYNPSNGETTHEVRAGFGLKSGVVAGCELIQNPALKSRIRSLDFYIEYMFHSDRFYHNTTTTYPEEYPGPSVIKNRITELQDWETLLLYPRIKWNTSSPQWTIYFAPGVGFNSLKSGDFFVIHQTIDQGEEFEISPVKLYRKEQMRRGRNFSGVIGAGLTYTVSRNTTFTLGVRYMQMMRRVNTDLSLYTKPLQSAPLYYVDQELFMAQYSFIGGVSFNIGACPKWLGF